VTSTSVSDFTLDVQVSTAPPTVTGGGVIFIGSGSNNNTQPSNNGTISNNGSVITINWNGNNGNTNTSSNTSIQIKGSVGDYYYNRIGSDARQRLGSAQANEVSLGTDIWKQDFQGGTIFHGPKGSYLLAGTLHHNYYNVLSASDRQRLGMPISNETPDGGYWHQSFENGVLQLVSNAPVAWNNNSQNQTQTQSSYINENAYGRTDTQWAAKVFSWDSSRGKPPADFFNGNTIAELDLGSNDLGNGRKGLKFDVGTGSLRNSLPSDAFAVRAYTQASFDGGQYKFSVRGDDGFQIFAKNIVTNEWIYITPKDEWQQAYGSHQEITYGLPQGRYDLHFHYFEGGGNAYFDLSWEKLGGISNSAGFNAANFRGSVKPTDGINIRSGPGTNFAIVGSTAGGTLSFDGWKVGTSHYDQEAGQYDDRWFRIQGTNTWVASAYINGNPNQSVVAGTLPSDNTTLTTNQSPLFSSPTLQNPLTGFSSPLGENLVVNQGNGGTFSHVDRMQYAVDYDAAIGTSVYAMRSGKVIEVSDIYPDTGGGASNINRFNYVLIEHDGGYRSAYLHLQQNFNNRVGLKIGDIVNGGQLIGYSGNSGWSTGPHLHVEVHKGYFGQTVPFTISGVSSNSPQITNPNAGLPILNLPGTTLINNFPGLTTIQSPTKFYASENLKKEDGDYATVKLVGMDKTSPILSDRSTWIVIHGMNGGNDGTDGRGKDNDFWNFCTTIEGYQENDQVIALDWSAAALSKTFWNGSPDPNRGGSWITKVAEFASRTLLDLNISPKNINIVGHSLGAYLGYEISHQVNIKKGSGINRLIALDPATTTRGGYTDESKVDFKLYSTWSWGFYGSILGSESATKTADESFFLSYKSGLSPDVAHGAVRDVFGYMLNNKSGNVSKIFNLDNVKGTSAWTEQHEGELVVAPGLIPDELIYYNTWWNPFDDIRIKEK
jgi:murein DD-endopeptidase MepM/ murein hydrolase activator NlpD